MLFETREWFEVFPPLIGRSQAITGTGEGAAKKIVSTPYRKVAGVGRQRGEEDPPGVSTPYRKVAGSLRRRVCQGVEESFHPL